MGLMDKRNERRRFEMFGEDMSKSLRRNKGRLRYTEW